MVSEGETVSSRALRVIVCDDTHQVRALIKTELSLEPDMIVVGEAANGAEAIDLARLEQPDVVLLDLCMPVKGGLEALPEIKQAAPSTRVIVFSSFDVAEMGERAVAAGASSYIQKSAPSQQIVAAVRTTDQERRRILEGPRSQRGTNRITGTSSGQGEIPDRR